MSYFSWSVLGDLVNIHNVKGIPKEAFFYELRLTNLSENSNPLYILSVALNCVSYFF